MAFLVHSAKNYLGLVWGGHGSPWIRHCLQQLQNRRFNVPQPTFLFPLETPLRLSRNMLQKLLPPPLSEVNIVTRAIGLFKKKLPRGYEPKQTMTDVSRCTTKLSRKYVLYFRYKFPSHP